MQLIPELVRALVARNVAIYRISRRALEVGGGNPT